MRYNYRKCGLKSLTDITEEVGCNTLHCEYNNLKDLQGCPDEIECLMVDYNRSLKDISDLPKKAFCISIKGCNKIEVFTKEIDNEDGTLFFASASKEMREKIKQWRYYEVVEESGLLDLENNGYIKVRIKNLGRQVIDSI